MECSMWWVKNKIFFLICNVACNGLRTKYTFYFNHKHNHQWMAWAPVPPAIVKILKSQEVIASNCIDVWNHVCGYIHYYLIEARWPICLSGLGSHLFRYYRLSIYCCYIWYDIAHSTTITLIKLWSCLYSWTTPHTSPLRASYGVSFVSHRRKMTTIYRDYTVMTCCLFLTKLA